MRRDALAVPEIIAVFSMSLMIYAVSACTTRLDSATGNSIVFPLLSVTRSIACNSVFTPLFAKTVYASANCHGLTSKTPSASDGYGLMFENPMLSASLMTFCNPTFSASFAVATFKDSASAMRIGTMP